MKVVLGTFARSELEASLGCDAAVGVRVALRHYVRRRSAPAVVTDLPGGQRWRLACPGEDLELVVEPEVEEALEREARRSHWETVEQLARHAVLSFLADLDGRAPDCERRPLARL